MAKQIGGILLLLLWLLTGNQLQTQTTVTLLITEVYYDTPGE